MVSDELEVRIRKIELEYQDIIEMRNALMLAEWAVPAAIFSALVTAIASGKLSADWFPLILYGIGIYVLYRAVRDERRKKDSLLVTKRAELDGLIAQSKIPDKAPPEKR